MSHRQLGPTHFQVSELRLGRMTSDHTNESSLQDGIRTDQAASVGIGDAALTLTAGILRVDVADVNSRDGLAERVRSQRLFALGSRSDFMPRRQGWW